MGFIDQIQERARAKAKHLVLPEGTEPRTVAAAAMILKDRIAKEVTLLGKPEAIKAVAAKEGVDLTGVHLVDPETSDKRKAYADRYYELRKAKGMTPEQAWTDINDQLRFGCMMLHIGDVDAMVAGAENTTGDVLKAAFTIVKTKPGIKYASSCFVMGHPDPQWGENGYMIYSDCGTITEPTAEQLAAGIVEYEPNRALVLISWLHHVSANLEKSVHYRTHRWWLAQNIENVLNTIKA